LMLKTNIWSKLDKLWQGQVQPCKDQDVFRQGYVARIVKHHIVNHQGLA
jgi:hypothetical protein